MKAKQGAPAKRRKGGAPPRKRPARDRLHKELSRIASAVSLDLKEPLLSAISSAELLYQRYGGLLDNKALTLIEGILDRTRHVERLLNDFLAYAQVHEAGRPFEPLNCHSILATVLFNLKPLIEKTSSVITADALPTVMGDETQFILLFHNLIDNAIKFRGDNTALIHISAHPMGKRSIEKAPGPASVAGASYLEDKSGWLFTVADNGIGVDPRYGQSIFRMFKGPQGKDAQTGAGIGLALCKQIVERHGGRIWVESEPGQGSTFYFTLPQGGERRLPDPSSY